LQDRYALDRHLHAQVAARHHQPVGLSDDGIEVGYGCRLLDLGHDGGGLPDKLAGELDVLAALHERQGHPIDAEAQCVVEIGLVLVGERADRQHGVGQADALAAGQRAADLDGCLDRRCGLVRDGHANLAVVEQQGVARRDGRENLRVRQEHALGVAVLVGGVEAKRAPLRQCDTLAADATDAEFRTLQVSQDADRPLELGFGRADSGMQLPGHVE